MSPIRKTRSRGADPTQVRLSEHFLLSDFMGNHSVFSKGLANRWDGDEDKLAEGRHLCETLLEPLMATYGPLSVAYGYVSPDLSKKIVTYQDPNMPSYHRWDKGAAADVCVHAQVEQRAPIYLAHDIDQMWGYSRMITYSESPYICLATQINEGSRPRRAFYENRYCGKAKGKPHYIKKSPSPSVRAREAQDLILEHDWRGAGYPTYHGGGIRQFQHIRVSRYSMVSDYLYSAHACSVGVPNAPDMNRVGRVFRAAGKLYDYLLETLDIPRLSVVRGFESFRFNDYPLFSWKDHFAIDFIPPSYLRPDEVAQAMEASGLVVSFGVDNTTRRVRAVGHHE